MNLKSYGMIVGFLLCLVGLRMADAEEWPRWRGPRGDGISREPVATPWPSGVPRVLWRAKVGLGYASPIAFEGRIYLFHFQADGDREVLTAYAADSGKVLWTVAGEAGFGGGVTDSYPGTRATPTIDEVSRSILTFGSAGELMRRELATGKMLWRMNVLQATGAQNLDWGVASSPLHDAGRVIVQGGQGGPLAVAVDFATGRLLWKSALRGNAGFAAPVLVDIAGRKQVIVVADEVVAGMDATTGATVWSIPWHNAFSLPIVRGAEVFLTSARGPGATLLQLSGDGAHKVWSNHELTARFNPPILDGEVLYGNSEGVLKCIGWSDGALKWSAKKPDYKLGMGGSLLRSGDKLILLGDRGLLSVVRATPAGVEKLAQVQLLDGDQNWSTPLLYRGHLYLRGPSEFLALELPSGK